MSQLTDLEITRLCAAAMGLPEWPDGGHDCRPVGGDHRDYWQPLHDDAQAMALVKKFHLHIGKTLRTPDEPFGQWFVSKTDKYEVPNNDLNRAICECVAKMQAAK